MTRPETRGRACCPPGWLTRRQLIAGAGKATALLGVGGLLAGCVRQPEPLARTGGLWNRLGDAPFSRHAHSAAPWNGRLLVMGQRQGVAIMDGETPEGDPVTSIHFHGTEFEFSTDDPLDVPSGEPIRITFTNDGLVDHDITFPDSGVYLRASPGETVETVAVFDEPEVFFCSIGGHADVGMVGSLGVDGAVPVDEEVPETSGSTEMWWYDPIEDTWEEAPRLPHSYDHVTMVTAADGVYSIGGYTGDIGSSRADVFVLSEGASEWERRSDLPAARGGMAGASDGERIYVAGGRSEAEGTPSAADVFAYSPTDDRWERLDASLPTGRDHIAGVVVEGVFWIIGGRGDGRRISSTPVTEGLVIDSGEWIVGTNVPIPNSALAVAAIGSQVVVFGGEGPSPTPQGAAGVSYEVYPQTLIYEPADDRWTRAPNAPMAVHHPAYGVIDDVLYSVGGGPVSGVSSTRAVQSFRLAE